MDSLYDDSQPIVSFRPRWINYILFIDNNRDKELLFYGSFLLRGRRWRLAIVPDNEPLAAYSRMHFRYNRIETWDNGVYEVSDIWIRVGEVDDNDVVISWDDEFTLETLERETQPDDPVVTRLRYLIDNNPIPHRS